MATATLDSRAARAEQHGVRETRRAPMPYEFREKPDGTGGSILTYTGYAYAAEQTYTMYDMFGEYEEVMRNGAAKSTIAQGCDTAFLLNHEGMTLARTKPGTLQLSEDDFGLLTVAQFDPKNFYVQALRSAIERGDIDEMSLAFRVMRQQWSPDYMQRDIIEINLHQGDVSAVNYGANPHTGGTVSIRGKAIETVRALGRDSIVEALREVRAGKALSTATTTTLQQVLSLTSDADDAVDQVQIILSELMGVPNPDDDSQWDSLAAPDLSLYRARLALTSV